MDTTNSDCLLTYVFSTYPNPLQTSTPQTPLNGRINIGVLSSGQNIYCNEIIVVVLVGTDAAALTAGSVDTSLNTDVWSIISKAPDSRDGSAPSADTVFSVSFICTDKNSWLINYNLVLGLEAQVNQTAGDFTIQIYEVSGTDPQNMSRKGPATFTLSKQTQQFYLQNMVTTTVDAPTVPATEFKNGQDISFEWESNGTFFQLYEKGNAKPVYSGMNTNFILKGGVQNDSTFFLVAMMTGDPGGDVSAGGYEPIYLYESLAVTISNSTLTPDTVTASGDVKTTGNLSGNGLTVTGTSTLTGPTTVGKKGANDPLTVNLSTELTNRLQVDGVTTLKGGLIASGTTKLEADAVVTGPFTANGSSTFNGSTTLSNTTVKGSGTYNGGQTFYGGVTIWGGNPANNPSHFDAGNNRLYMGWLPPVDEAHITFKLSDDSGMIGYKSSSRRFKENIRDFSDDFHKILQARPVAFVYKGDENSRGSIGYIAEEFDDLGLRDLVVYDKEGFPAVIKYDRMALYHQEIIKGLIATVEGFKQTIAAQSESIYALEARVKALEGGGGERSED